MPETVTAEDMARKAGVSAKVFRGALRREPGIAHAHYERWTTEAGSQEHHKWQAVLNRCVAGKRR